jgi:hypothetical protein
MSILLITYSVTEMRIARFVVSVSMTAIPGCLRQMQLSLR